MRKVLTTVLAICAILAITSGALAAKHASSAQGRSARLARVVAHLRRQLHTVTLARNTWKSSAAATTAALQSSQEQLGTADQQIASLQGQIGNLQIQVGSLQDEAASLQEQGASLQGQVTSLQGQLASSAPPPPSAAAIKQVQDEVAWAQAGSDPRPTGELDALSAMNYVVGHVSTAEYGYLEITGGTLPDPTTDSILGSHAGICGQATIAFAGIMSQLGLQVRSAQFYFDAPGSVPDSHIAVEVYYAGGWHFYDPTFGVYWTDVNGGAMSITDVRVAGGTEHKDTASFTNVVEDPWFNGDDTAFLTDPSTDVVIGADPLQ